MKVVLIIGGLIVIMAGVWILQQPAPTVPNDSVVETTTSADGTADAESNAAATDTSVDTEAAANLTLDDTEAEVEAEAGSTKEFTIDSFSFGYSMDEIRVNEGDTVTITLTNSDGFHDWVVDEFDAATETIREGETTTVTFVAGEAGTYEYYCSVGNHRAEGMVGTLVVE